MIDNVNTFKESLDQNHVLYTMLVEHELILGFLDELEKLNNKIQKSNTYEEAKAEMEELKKFIGLVMDAEPHHQREEQILFTELEKNGFTEPPKVMRWEHHELRQLKHDINEFAINADFENYEITKKDLNPAVTQLVTNLRSHIMKENNILYPMSLNFISNNEKWKEMKKECDKIGYCSFTPLHTL